MAGAPFVFEGTQANFTDLVLEGSKHRPVLVDFWASWCAPCQMLMPVLLKLVQNYQGQLHLVKINADEQPALTGQFAVRSLPSLKLFKAGQVVEEIAGVQSESVLRQLLDRYIDRASDGLLDAVQQLIEQGDFEKAQTQLEQIADPDNPLVTGQWARLALKKGDLVKARLLISQMPITDRSLQAVKAIEAELEFSQITQDSPGFEVVEAAVSQNEEDLLNRYRLSAFYVLSGEYEKALSNLLEVVKRNRHWDDGAASKAMLRVFDLLGGEGNLVSQYRRQMANLLH